MHLVAWGFYGGLMKLLHSKYLGIRFFPWPVAGLWGNHCWKVVEFPSGATQIRHYVRGATTYGPTLPKKSL